MHTLRKRACFALTAAFGFAASAARAETITPDSISNPPSVVGSANGSGVSLSNLVSTQYMGLGLSFYYGGTAISNLNGISVWAPVQAAGNQITVPFPPLTYPWGKINYLTPWYGASLTSLVTRNPMSVSTLTVETIGNPGFLSVTAYGRNGLPLNIAPTVQSVPGSNGEKLWSFTGSAISGFSAVVVPPPGVAESALANNSAWGVAAVSFTPPAGQAPEPSSLVLAGLGALGLAVRFGRRCRAAGLAATK